jgi:predicted MPP superfamily phosphohydrolase
MSEQLSGLTNRMLHAWREQVQISLALLMHELGRDRFHASDFAIVPLEVRVPGLATEFDGYRIVQISDLHMGHWVNAERLNGVAELINQQEPDLVVITGDFISYSLSQIAEDMTAGLRKITAVDGVVAVLGNHDHWFDPQGVRHVLQDAGVQELANDVKSLRRGEAVLHVAGVDDILVGADDLDRVLEIMPDQGPAILLAHEPDFADESAASGRFALQLSGHSHGGQILLPGLGPYRGEMFRKYPLGRYQVGDMVQYTNPGIGTHVLRLRINCPPEITTITLKEPEIVR